MSAVNTGASYYIPEPAPVIDANVADMEIKCRIVSRAATNETNTIRSEVAKVS